MATTPKFKGIRVDYVDNELLVFAINIRDNRIYKLCRFTGENFQRKTETWEVSQNTLETAPAMAKLPGGLEYDLLLVGINWGGPSNFEVTVLQTDGSEKKIPQLDEKSATVKNTLPTGAVWTPEPIRITV